MDKPHLVNAIFGQWKNISISARLYLVVGTMALLVIVELFTLHFAMGNLSAVRAFVGGEASWSKAQKNAVYRFQRYALSKNEADYLAFHESLIIPAGDRQARTELEKLSPDMEAVSSGFIQGRIHPDDVESMVLLLKRFHNISYIAKALDAWKDGDRLLQELRVTAEGYYELAKDEGKNKVRMQEHLDNIVKINDELTKVEEVFSTVLGEGSRWMENIILMILIVLVVTIESIGLTLTFLTSKAISKGLSNLNELSQEFGHGQLERRLAVDSRDEIGQLTHSVNKMGDLLQKSYSDLKLSHRDLEQKIHSRTIELENIAYQNSELYKKAQTAVKMRDDFLSIASHELRTPLTALNLQLYLLEKTDDIEQVKNISKRAGSLVKKLGTLQEVLMDLAQLRAGKIELKKSRVDLVMIATDCVFQLASEASRFGAQIFLQSDHPVMTDVDTTRISQVITNLLTNALKYGEGGEIKIKIYEENNFAFITVQDKGQGIPLEKQEQIFERFERVSEDPAVSGLGLGLYITRQIVDAHNGSITIESSPGKGAIFKVQFPMRS